MKRLLEPLAFTALAVLAHLIFIADFRTQDGLQSGGVGGAALITLAAAPPQIETMVEAWDTPPETAVAQTMPKAPAQPDVAPPPPTNSFDAPPAMPGAVALPSNPINKPQLPQFDSATPEPPVSDLAVKSSRRPKTRPEPPKKEIAKPKPQAKPKPTQKAQAKKKPTPKPAPKKAAKKAKTAQKATAGRAAQKAAGSGGSSSAGNAGKSKTAILSKGKQQRLISVWGGRIRAKIERSKRYPRGAKKRGRVVLRLSISPSGSVRGVSIARSSGNSALDKAAIAAVRRAGRMPRAPKGLNNASYRFNLPISFQ
ncbi:TonB family protein [Rhodobacteraceae bacterium D3-12]|nr:TonB family protein [Rhodobacteraceae bacterium D3-12]